VPHHPRRRAPFLVAHRAGNDLARLREAERFGAALVEADVRRFRGRVEVRHLKTVGPLPILWDRWRLENPFTPRLLLGELLAALSSGEPMLDLKGRDPRLAAAVLELLRPRLAAGRRVTVCARSRRLLDPFVGLPGVSIVHSVGSRRQLRAFRRSASPSLDGISVHERLLDLETVRDLRERAGLLMTWPVKTLERARELAAWGVDGLISENLELAQALREASA
jgi:glycerophosphoryl diester phosphodiesterase